MPREFFCKIQLTMSTWAMGVALLAEQLLPTSDDLGSNPAIGNFNKKMFTEKVEKKKKRPGMSHFYTMAQPAHFDEDASRRTLPKLAIFNGFIRTH